MRTLIFFALTAAALPAIATEPKNHGPWLVVGENDIVTKAGIRVVGLDPPAPPIRPARPFRLELRSKPQADPKKQYKATPPSFRNSIRHGFVQSVRSTIGIGYGRSRR